MAVLQRTWYNPLNFSWQARSWSKPCIQGTMILTYGGQQNLSVKTLSACECVPACMCACVHTCARACACEGSIPTPLGTKSSLALFV
jgi:hypothetical protein